MNPGSKKLLEVTKGFILSLDEARDLEALGKAVLDFTSQFGAEYVLAGTIPSSGTPPLLQKQNVLLNKWPSEWTNRYFRRNYIFSDPIIATLFETTQPFYWDEATMRRDKTQKSSLVMNEAAEHGLKRGITIPLFTIEDNLIGFSLAGPHLEKREDVRHAITIIANYAIARAIALREAGKAEVRLTVRERQVLQWIAEGHLRHEIADIMMISEHGVDKHLRSCREKLGAKTTSFAVAEALRRRMIS